MMEPFTAAAAAQLEQRWQWSEDQLRNWQLQELNKQLQAILPSNSFYRSKFDATQLQLKQLDELASLPLTEKSELVTSAGESPAGVSAHHTFDRTQYSRIHRTSGTTGKPLLLLDTMEDWKWWSATWQNVLQAAGVTSDDQVFMAFSFGPFIGFWSAHQACVDRGATVIPGGGLSTLARLEFMLQTRPSIVCCTPSYALHMAEVAQLENVPIDQIGVRRLIVAGEAGGSIAAVRQKMEQAWQAQVVDHSGATEIGPWGFGWPDQPGLHIIEANFIAEFLPIEAADSHSGKLHELVLTSLGRLGAPVFRYRTGDIVRYQRMNEGRCRYIWLPEGVSGRADNMVTIRGVNIFPSSIDAIVRELPTVREYQVIVARIGELDQMEVEVEADEETAVQLAKLLSTRLGLRLTVRQVAANSLPRSEFKSRRWIDNRSNSRSP